jgi:hypothetical protein
VTAEDARVAWVAAALAEGFRPSEIAAKLGEGGEVVVASVLRSPVWAGLRDGLQRGARARDAAALSVARLQRHGQGLPTYQGVPGRALTDVHLPFGVPAVWRGACAGWPAMGWTLPSLAERLGDAEVTASVGRERDPECDRNFRAHAETMRFDAFLSRVAAAPAGNDLYLIANGRNAEGPLASLLHDLHPPLELLGLPLRGACSLWIGPAGTHTPAHHDTSSVLFCQIMGRKRVWLASPQEDALIAAADGFYASGRLSDGSAGAGAVLDVTLAPGDALLLPVGWWHEVYALDTSISASVTAFGGPNRYDAYQPGAVCLGVDRGGRS